MIDIDDFKRLNDSHGHLMGDEVLKSVARTLKNQIRTVDIAARYGGEEFILVLPETDLSGASIVAEKVRQAVEKIEMPDGPHGLRVTISLGLAVFPLHADHKEALIRSADEALYASKHAGKNRVSIGVKAA